MAQWRACSNPCDCGCSRCEQNSYAIVQQHFRNAFSDVQVPQKSTIKKIIDRFRTYHTHTIDNLSKTGRPLLHTEENVDKVVSKFEQNPNILIRQAAAVSGISKTTMHNIVRKFGLKPFCFSTLQEFKPNDPAKHLMFCVCFKRFIHDRRDVLDTTFFTDEVWFHPTCYINAQNFCTWSSTNPHTYQEASLHHFSEMNRRTYFFLKTQLLVRHTER